MATDTKLKELIINKLTTSQYDSIEEKDPNQLYIVTDAPGFDNTITNCITHIPQDIKLELVDGTLTLKAGSKVYVPNGSGVFDEVVVANDLTLSDTYTYTGKVFIMSDSYGTFLVSERSEVISSGSSPGYHDQYGSWYDTTTTNIIKRTTDSGSTWNGKYSFPIAICSYNNGFLSIDQVFNGFGYIGSTIFALPGVKGLIPNGRNEDGTLKNIEFTIDSVKTATRTWVDGNSQVWGYVKNPPTGVGETWYWNRYIESDEEPSRNEYVIWYKPSENITYVNNGAQSSTPNWEKVNYINFGKASGISSQEIKIFTPKTAFHAVDYNDSPTISGWGIPSDKYMDLTLGASGATYTAPANGYFFLAKTATAQKQYIDFVHKNSSNDTVYIDSLQSVASNTVLRKNSYVYRGEDVQLNYDVSGTTHFFRFIYAKGEI